MLGKGAFYVLILPAYSLQYSSKVVLTAKTQLFTRYRALFLSSTRFHCPGNIMHTYNVFALFNYSQFSGSKY